MANLFLKPARIIVDGVEVSALVRDPDSGVPLSVLGEWKPATPFWLRRIRDADVIDATAEAIAVPAKPPIKARSAVVEASAD